MLKTLNKAEKFTLPNFKTYHKATVMTTVYWHTDRHTDQWNRTESPEISLRTYGRIIFDKGARPRRERTVFFQPLGLGKLNTHMHKNEIGLLSTTIGSKSIRELNIRAGGRASVVRAAL